METALIITLGISNSALLSFFISCRSDLRQTKIILNHRNRYIDSLESERKTYWDLKTKG